MAQGNRRDLRAQPDPAGEAGEEGERRPGFERFVLTRQPLGGTDLLGREAGMVLDPEDVEATLIGDPGDLPQEAGAIAPKEAAVQDRGQPDWSQVKVANRLSSGVSGCPDDASPEEGVRIAAASVADDAPELGWSAPPSWTGWHGRSGVARRALRPATVTAAASDPGTPASRPRRRPPAH
jgi:hypothetical protein